MLTLIGERVYDAELDLHWIFVTLESLYQNTLESLASTPGKHSDKSVLI